MPVNDDPPWSYHLTHLAAPYHDRSPSTLEALSLQLEEAQVRTHHCQILLEALAETCKAASELSGVGISSSAGSIKEWKEIKRKHRDISAGLEQMQRHHGYLGSELERARALAAKCEREIKTSGWKNGDGGNR
jgi:hypothetical protein